MATALGGGEDRELLGAQQIGESIVGEGARCWTLSHDVLNSLATLCIPAAIRMPGRRPECFGTRLFGPVRAEGPSSWCRCAAPAGSAACSRAVELRGLDGPLPVLSDRDPCQVP
ncbi:hypothetical protein GCM10018781_66070 [Kitasatospora indigofera]|uniref:Uncharacterized protein n=1 Tax=Kitasatospora indigofera TaxID=67307 RepID=A0A919GDH3_9ACTN|nr:hypothetical protein GCM10018781_66070 [Kitasatospora indigofera]